MNNSYRGLLLTSQPSACSSLEGFQNGGAISEGAYIRGGLYPRELISEGAYIRGGLYPRELTSEGANIRGSLYPRGLITSLL